MISSITYSKPLSSFEVCTFVRACSTFSTKESGLSSIDILSLGTEAFDFLSALGILADFQYSSLCH